MTHDNPPQKTSDDVEGASRYAQELIHLVTQDTRYSLILDILAHPERAPSLKELNYMNPSKGRTTIVSHLDKLTEYGIIEKRVIPGGERDRSLPNTFYTISTEGEDFLEYHGLVPLAEGKLRQEYATVEKPADVERYEKAPRSSAIADVEASDPEKAEKLRRLVHLYQSTARTDVDSSSNPFRRVFEAARVLVSIAISILRGKAKVVDSSPRDIVNSPDFEEGISFGSEGGFSGDETNRQKIRH